MPKKVQEEQEQEQVQEHCSSMAPMQLLMYPPYGPVEQAVAVTRLAFTCHEANKTRWRDPATHKPIQRNVGELLMLCVSELAEAMEGHRKGLQDDKLPHRPMLEVELAMLEVKLADCLIRVFDLAGGLGLDLGGAFAEKMQYNRDRVDHKPEARLAEGGKRY